VRRGVDIARQAWEKWRAKALSGEMVENYRRAILRAAEDPAVAEDYIIKVGAWIDTMRSPEVRSAIAAAVARAKERYYSMVQSMATPARPEITVRT